MKKLNEILPALSLTANNALMNGQTGQAETPASPSQTLTDNTPQQGTGRLEKVNARPTGSPSGATGVAVMTEVPPNKEIALQEAKRNLLSLPPMLLSWLHGKARSETDYAGMGLDIVGGYDRRQELSIEPAERRVAEQVYANLRKVYASAKETRNQKEVVGIVLKLFSLFPFGLRHDAQMIAIKADAWAEELEKYPLWAIKQAYEWDKRSSDEPTLGSFIESVKLACGSKEAAMYKSLHELLHKGVNR